MTDTIHVATSYQCDTATRKLGEDYLFLKAIAESFTLLRQSIEAARHLVRSEDGSRMLTDLDVFLVDANHDTGVYSVTERAKEAFTEAKVVPIKRPASVPEFVEVKK